MGDVGTWLQSLGVLGALLLIGGIIFAESGLLVGIFLPGDTLLFSLGFFASQGKLPLIWVMVTVAAAAVLGDNLGYFFGSKAGPRIFRSQDGIVFRQEYIVRAKQFYDRYGGITVLFARFLPYVRTVAPMIAGAAGMRRVKFIFYNIVGALLWTVVLTLFGFWLGLELARRIESYLGIVYLGAVIFAFSPTLLFLATNRRVRQALFRETRDLFRRAVPKR